MRSLPLRGIREVAFDPFVLSGGLVCGEARERVCVGAVGFEEDVGGVGEEEDGHFFLLDRGWGKG